MAAMGLGVLRLGALSWAKLEPEPGQFDWTWLDQAVETFGGAGLKLVLGVPTATPPGWLTDRRPEILARDVDGRPRGLGSRGLCDVSSPAYRAEAARFTEAMSARYGQNPAVEAWQTDNDFGCPETATSHSPVATAAFRDWLEARYGGIEALNIAWGMAFWSRKYRSFTEIDPPLLSEARASPVHRMDHSRFVSDQVTDFNRMQADIFRRNSPGRDVIQKVSDPSTLFDQFALASGLDVASWDSHPLALLEQLWFSAEDKARYLRQGHPDIAAFNHDLYRGCGRGRWWVMAQQAGPASGAAWNPAPLPGMVRAWTWEAFAHGAEVVSYSRWRQAPFGQEQYQSGLHLPDGREDLAAAEVRQLAKEVRSLGPSAENRQAATAMVFSHEADWLFRIEPQGRDFQWLRLAFETYSALRRRGLDVDIVPPDADLSGYRLVVLPSQPILDPDLAARLKSSGATVWLGPRSGSKTRDLALPADLPPGGPLRELIDFTVQRVESLRPGADPTIEIDDEYYAARAWRETLETTAQVLATFEGGHPAWLRQGRFHYLATWPGESLFDRLIGTLAKEAGLTLISPQRDVRLRRRGDLRFAINYGPGRATCPAPAGAEFLMGERQMPAAAVTVWREPA